jgi:hypothetical protein
MNHGTLIGGGGKMASGNAEGGFGTPMLTFPVPHAFVTSDGAVRGLHLQAVCDPNSGAQLKR